MKGRRLTIVLVMLLVLICALAFVGCQEKKPNEPVTPQQPEHTHVAFLVEAKEATCTEEGNNAYYLCTCGLAFKDEAMTIPTYAYAEVIAKKDHVYNKTEISREALKEAATCQSAAVYYYSCTCGAIDNGENANTFVFGEKAAHNTVYVPAVDATCETAGNIAYYTCGSCGMAFKDAEAMQQFSVTETVVVPAEGHVTTAHERIEPTCTEAGVAAYWSCDVCGKMFSDAGCTNVITTANRAIPKLGHEYSEQLPLAKYKATDATCSAVATYYCSCVRCGEAGTATFGYGEKAPHTPEAVAAVAPTCTSDGNIAYYSCKVCAALFSDPACTTEVAYADVVIAKLGHVYNQEVATSAYLKTPATCLSQAVYFKSCVCGNFSEDTFTAGDYGAHVMTEAGYHASVAPDCEKDGSIAYFTCSVCSKDCTLDGKEIKNAADKVVAALGHDYAEIADADNLVSAATCTSPAIYKKVCTRCDQAGTERFSYGEKLAHSFEAWTERKESDCVNDGNVRYRHCVTCNKNYDEFETEIVNVVIEKLGHDFNGKVVDDRYLATAATCTAPAQYYRSCTRCEMSSKEDSTLTAQLLFEVGDALGHKLGTIIAKVDADCLNDGVMAHYECERCAVYFNEEKTEVKLADIIIEKLGHDFSNKVAAEAYFVSAATCVDAAVYYCSCVRCALASDETFEYGTALGHTYGELIPRVNADCENDGAEAHYVCSVCSVWFDAEKVETAKENLILTKLGHDYTRQVVDVIYLKSAATCTSPAIYYCSCFNCNSSSYETEYEQTFEIGASAPHVFGDWILEKDPTCTEDGNIKYRSCSSCSQYFDINDAVVTNVVVAKLGHDFTAQVAEAAYLVSAADCVNVAVYYCSCSRCKLAGEETFEYGTALGHTYGTLIAKVDADCLNDGLDAHYICSVCSVWFDAEKVETTAEALVITKLGHDFTAQVVDAMYFVSAANCVDAAKYYCSCTRCSLAGTETFEVGSALGHSYGTLVAKVEADCLNDGLDAHYICSVCSVWFDAEKVETTEDALVIEKIPHNFSVRSETVAVPATCTEAALYFCSCSVCSLISDDLANTVAYGDPKGHVYGELIAKVDADCENDGLDAHYICADCSVWFTAEKVATTQEALVIKTSGHNYGTLIEGVPATCLKEGNISYYNCSVCSKYFDENKTEVTSIVIEKLTHDYTRQVVKDIYLKTPATCVAPAVYYYSCYHCDSSSVGTEFENTFEAGITAPHVYGEWVSRVEPTCTTDGNVKYRYCSVCEKNYDEAEVAVADVTIAQLGHDFTAQVADAKYLASAANCEDPAEYYCSCTRCELAGTETFENGDALGHTYGELIARVEPTYVMEGTIAHYTCSVCAKNFDESKKEVNDLSVPRTLPTAGVGTYDETGKYLPGQYVVSGSGENAVYGDLPYAVERKNGAYVINGRLIYDANTKNYPYIIRFDADFATYYSKVADNTVILKYAYADGTVYATFTKADAFANDFSFIFKGDALKGDAQCLFLDPTVATEDWIVYQISIGSDVVCPKEVPAAEATYWYNGWNTYYVDMLREGKYFADIDCKTELTAEQVFVKEKLSISGMTAGINAQVGVDVEENPVYGFTTSSAYSVVMVNGVYTVVGNIACNNDRSDVSSVKLVVRIDGNFKQFYRVIAHETVIVRLTVGENVVEITKGNAYFTEDGAIVIIFALEKGQTLTVDVLNPLTEKFDALTYTIVVDDGATYVHNMEVRNAIPATYWSEGCTEYVECADCGKQVGYKVVEKLVPTMTPILSDEAHVYTVSYKDGKYVISGNPKFELPEGNLEAGYRVKIKFGCEFGNAYAGFADTDVIIVVNVGGTEYKITKADLDEDGGFTLTLNVTEEMEFSITFINPDEDGENAVYSFIVKGITNA
ncbi:MAG: hypothetical protein PUB81_01880 [Clostridiales bacterium]|nr:hypothetical protein [Clostridiales bacterium]